MVGMRGLEIFLFSSHTWPTDPDPFDLSDDMAKLAGIDENPACLQCGVSRVDGQNHLCTSAVVRTGNRFQELTGGHYILTMLDQEDLPSACTRCGLPRKMALEVPCSAGKNEPERTGLTQLVVTHTNESVTYHSLSKERPLRIDAGSQTLVIGKGLGRVMVPLIGVLYYSIEEA